MVSESGIDLNENTSSVRHTFTLKEEFLKALHYFKINLPKKFISWITQIILISWDFLWCSDYNGVATICLNDTKNRI